MKLNRKQKTLRNFLLAAALLLLWWVLTGMNPITPGQALRWQAQEWGLKETPRVVCRVKDGTRKANVVFTADDRVGLARTEWNFIASSARIDCIRPKEETTLLHMAAGYEVELFAYTQVPGAAEAECSVHIRSDINNQWFDETYTMISPNLGSGVFAFPLEPKELKELTVQDTAFLELSNILRHGWDSFGGSYTITITFRDEAGTILHTYEEHLKGE